MENKINQVLGKYYGFKGIPALQIPFFLFFALCLSPFLIFDKVFYLISVGAVSVIWLYATGEKPFQAIETILSPRTWSYYSPKIEITKAGIPKLKVPRASFYVQKGKKVKFVELEHQEFWTFFDFEDFGPIPCGAYVLKKGAEVKFRFGWKFVGLDAYADAIQMQSILERRYQAVNSLPENISFRVEEIGNLNGDEVLEHIENLSNMPNLTIFEGALLHSERLRVESMCSSNSLERRAFGSVQKQDSYLYATVKVKFGQTFQTKPSYLDKLINIVMSVSAVGLTDPDVNHWNNAARDAYDSFLQCDRTIRNSNGFGFQAKVLQKEDLWELDYSEYRTFEKDLGLAGTIPDVPQWVPVTSDGIQNCEITNDRHILGVINTPDYGFPPIVEAQRTYVRIPTTGKYAGYVRFGAGSKIKEFPACDGDPIKGMYLYLHNAVARKNDRLYDYKIIWEYVPDASDIEYINADRTMKGTLADMAYASEKKKTWNIAAETLQKEAIDAVKSLQEGDRPAFVTLGIWLYRDSVQELDSAMKSLLLGLYSSNAEIAVNCCDYIWNQSKRYGWQQLDTSPSDRRNVYFASESVVQMPSISPQKLDNKGIWFLDERFRTPVWFDLLHKSPNNFALIAEVGGSKSTVLFSFLMQACAYQYPTIMFEFPRPDGTSTFTEALELMRLQEKKIAYVDVRKNIINCLERTSLAHLELAIRDGYARLETCAESDRVGIVANIKFLEEKMNGAIEDTRSNHIEILVAFILGHEPDPKTAEIAEAMIADVYLAFIRQPEIIDDYDVAVRSGFGNPGYERMPTLPRFAEFAEAYFKERIDTDKTLFDSSRTAIDRILIGLNPGSLSSVLGRSIGGQSSFEIGSADVAVLSLTNVSANKDSLVYASIGMQLVAQKSILSEKSLFICEESTVLYGMVPWAKKIAESPPKLRKQGTVFGAAFQNIGCVFATPYGDQIFGNLQKKFILKINETTLKQVVEYLGFPKEIAKDYIGRTISPETLTSRLCVMDGNTVIPLLHCPSELHVAITATNLEEVSARARCKAKYGNPRDPSDIKWLITFSVLYSDSLRSGAPMSSICPVDSGWDDVKSRELNLL